MKAETDFLGRRSRMRASTTGKRVTLQERDLLWLQKIHQHGPLPSSFLLRYATHFGRSEKRAKERLCDLFHESNTKHGGAYLSRPRQQFQTIDSRYNQLVYELAPAGVRALKAHGGWRDTSGPSGGPWWHKLMVSCVTASIDLHAIARPDLTFIAQDRILKRAGTNLSCPVTFRHPVTKQLMSTCLRPDALFGLEYHTSRGSRFRFFTVEADRSTEPLRSAKINRKSISNSFAQYATYIGGGDYKAHLKLTAPMVLLNVASSETRMRAMISVLETHQPHCNYLLFQSWNDFTAPSRIPIPNEDFLDREWLRGAAGAVNIAEC